MNKLIERKIDKIYNAVFQKVFSRKNVSALASGSKVEMKQTVELLENSTNYNAFAIKFATELAKRGLSKSRGVWRKYYLAARRLHYTSLPTTFNEYEMQVLSKAVRQNFKMIKSIPSRTLEILEHKYTSTLIEEVAKGSLTRGSFKRELERHGRKNAKLVARTETAKLQTAITENRARSIGSVAYVWRSSNDQRTRQSHKDMNDVVVFWREQSQKPLLDNMRGNAGEFPNCRCDTEPIVDLEDLTKSTYRVYDYRYDKVVNMRRYELAAALKRGSLD